MTGLRSPVALLLVGFGLLAAAGAWTFYNRDLLAEGVTAEGAIRQFANRIIMVEVPDGARGSRIVSVRRPAFSFPRRGARVTIIYRADAVDDSFLFFPASARVKSFRGLWLWPVIMGVGGALLCGLYALARSRPQRLQVDFQLRTR
jgi:hypothetical protein